MIIFGVDPGYATIGYGIVEYNNSIFRTLDYGAIKTPPEDFFEKRLSTIYSLMNSIIKLYKPSDMAVENIYFTTNKKTAINVAQARGVIILSGYENNCKISEYTPLQVKQAVVGYGKAEKYQVMEMTKKILKLKVMPKLDDISDALAICVCHGHSGSSSKYNDNKMR
ncbi:MAG: crossover junction endodeoxyribonuclease RuvC [Oscillospiraceae bacterium]|nr:crossover junction endodeoxyribonuclease RuvC [Oscillospiraceae bacterium]